MAAMIDISTSFKDNLQQLPSIEKLARIDLLDASGSVAASIPNESGKQGSLAVYQYLYEVYGKIDAQAAEHGLRVFAEHTIDARNRPGAHPNIDRLIGIANGDEALQLVLVPRD